MKIAPTHYGRGLRHLAGVALGVLAATSDIAPALAQRVVPEVRTGGGGTGGGAGGGTGGGAGLRPVMPELRSAPAMPPPPMAPQVAPEAAPPVVAPAAPAPIIRFRCEVPSGENICKEPPPADGGSSDETCDCARDFCYPDSAGVRVCEKSAD